MMLWPLCPETKKMVQYSYSAEDSNTSPSINFKHFLKWYYQNITNVYACININMQWSSEASLILDVMCQSTKARDETCALLNVAIHPLSNEQRCLSEHHTLKNLQLPESQGSGGGKGPLEIA